MAPPHTAKTILFLVVESYLYFLFPLWWKSEDEKMEHGNAFFEDPKAKRQKFFNPKNYYTIFSPLQKDHVWKTQSGNKKFAFAQRGARTHDPEIKSLMLYRLS